jgi:dTDP-glucose pyrophosphorylase
LSQPLQKANDITVLIPAAGNAPEGVLALSNITCPAMIPVAGRPVIHWTMSYLRSLGLTQFRIAVARRGMFVEDFVECAFGGECDTRFMVPSRDGGVGQTVLELLERVETAAALIVLGDTYFQFADQSVLDQTDPFVLVNSVESSYRWCIAETDGNGFVQQLRDKEPGLATPLHALIGVYYFPDVMVARRAARAAVANTATKRTELSAILAGIRTESPIRAIAAGDWLDCGNADRQALSHRVLLQKRDFNELTIDAVLGTITKRSSNTEKLIDEINYLRLLPAELAVLFPRVLDYSTEWDNPWLTMEYYGYPALAEVFVFENVDPGIWEQLFLHLRDIMMTGFRRLERPLPDGALQRMYLDKTRERLEKLEGPEELLTLVRHPGTITVNGREVENVPLLWKRIESEIERLDATALGTVIHGDLCLSNILYDLRSRICKLIDPRGNFGDSGIYGDQRYDVAKLYHSVYGLYDFITNDLFKIAIDGRQVSLDIRCSPRHEQIRERFEKVFFPEYDHREVLLITALLFASMPALHYDAPQRQCAMYVRALQLFDEYFSNSSGSAAEIRECESVSISTE